MKRAVVVGGGLLGLLVLTWMVQAIVRHRNPQITLPMPAVRTAVEETIREQEQRRAQEQAELGQVMQESELLQAHQVIVLAQSEWGGSGLLARLQTADGRLTVDDLLLLARASELQKKLSDWSKETNQPLEDVYALEWAAHVQRVQAYGQRYALGIQGDAEGIAEARAIAGDTQAMLLLGDLMYSRQGVPITDTSIAREIARLAQVQGEVAARAQHRRDQYAKLESNQLTRAREYWETQTGNGVADLSPLAPAPAATEPGGGEEGGGDRAGGGNVVHGAMTRLNGIFYGEGSGDD